MSTFVIPNCEETASKHEQTVHSATYHNRKGLTIAHSAGHDQKAKPPLSRAAQIAARVAARYAQAPSYTERLIADGYPLPAATRSKPALQNQSMPVASESVATAETIAVVQKRSCPVASQAESNPVPRPEPESAGSFVPVLSKAPDTLGEWESQFAPRPQVPEQTLHPLAMDPYALKVPLLGFIPDRIVY